MANQDKKTGVDTELNSQAMALAEQLGRIAGTIEGTAEQYLNRASVTEQLTRVRDQAMQWRAALPITDWRARVAGSESEAVCRVLTTLESKVPCPPFQECALRSRL